MTPDAKGKKREDEDGSQAPDEEDQDENTIDPDLFDTTTKLEETRRRKSGQE